MSAVAIAPPVLPSARALAAAVALSVLPLVVTALLAAVAYAAVGDRIESPVAGIVLFETAVLLVAAVYLIVRPVTLRFEPLGAADTALALAAVPVPYVLGVATDRLLDPLGVEVDSSLSLSRESVPVAVPVALFLVGPAEELLYRGVVFGRLAEPFGTIPAVVVMALLFGAVHYPSYGADSIRDVGAGAAVGCLTTATVGAFYAGLYLVTGSLLVPVIAHSLYDAALFVRVASPSDDTRRETPSG